MAVLIFEMKAQTVRQSHFEIEITHLEQLLFARESSSKLSKIR